MSMQISISSNAEARLRRRAAVNGLTVDAYASEILERAGCFSAFDEELEPLREQVRHSGMTDGELNKLIEDIREEIYEERKQRSA